MLEFLFLLIFGFLSLCMLPIVFFMILVSWAYSIIPKDEKPTKEEWKDLDL